MNENERNQLRTIRTTKLLSQDFIPTQNHFKKIATHPISNKFLIGILGLIWNRKNIRRTMLKTKLFSENIRLQIYAGIIISFL